MDGEEDEDEVPSLPLGVTGNVYSLFRVCANSQGVALSSERVAVCSGLCTSGV